MTQNRQHREAPYHKVSLEVLIADYKRGYLTAKGALAYWICIRIKEGWELNFNAKEISEMFGMSRSSFWAALRQLKKDGEIDYRDPSQLKLKRLSKDSSGFCTESRILDSHPKNCTDIQNSGQPSNILHEQSLESIPSKDSTPLSTSYQTFKNSLSDAEREEFESFVEKEYGKPIKDYNAFLHGEHFAKWWGEFVKATGRVNWEGYDEFPQWLEDIKADWMYFLYERKDVLTLEVRRKLVEYVRANYMADEVAA